MNLIAYRVTRSNPARYTPWPASTQRHLLKTCLSQRRPLSLCSPLASSAPDPPKPKEFSGPKYCWHFLAESLEKYGPGGYHPVHLGDKFSNGRYEVVHKLGYGGYSMVWLCKDLQEDQYVSVKIAISELGDGERPKSYELETHHALRNGNAAHPGKRFVISLLDDFVHVGPNGSHQCFVFPVAVDTVATAKKASINDSNMFPSQIARSIAMQSLLGLSYIHACGIVHTDLHTENILMKASADDTKSIAKPSERPEELEVRRYDGAPPGNDVPRYQIRDADLYMPSDTAPSNCQVMISDFGEAYFVRDSDGPFRKTELHTPYLVRPPDIILGHPVTEAVDSWTLGMTIADILGRAKLFEDFLPDENVLMLEAISALGPPPPQMLQAWANRPKYFKDDGSSVKNEGSSAEVSKPLAVRLRERMKTESEIRGFGHDEAEIRSLETLIRSMLHYEPDKRMTVDQALKSEWARVYGIPALLECLPDVDFSVLA